MEHLLLSQGFKRTNFIHLTLIILYHNFGNISLGLAVPFAVPFLRGGALGFVVLVIFSDWYFSICANTLLVFSLGVHCCLWIFHFLSIWFSVFIKILQVIRFGIWCSILVFLFGLWLSTILMAIMQIHLSWIATKSLYASLFTSVSDWLGFLLTGIWKFVSFASCLVLILFFFLWLCGFRWFFST